MHPRRSRTIMKTQKGEKGEFSWRRTDYQYNEADFHVGLVTLAQISGREEKPQGPVQADHRRNLERQKRARRRFHRALSRKQNGGRSHAWLTRKGRDRILRVRRIREHISMRPIQKARGG